ncbi:MAG: aspartate carbamoyltransferase catalytic subunit [Candidatus Eisenbacteria bacterium]|nr:aspartate carbamoyltransferase catalytic subunit [Candidatus Eisenbacteria bacterium]
MHWTRKHLLGLEGVTRDEILTVLDTAAIFREILERPVKKVPTLRGVTIANLFFEASTRTRMSFELAEKRLSADTLNFSASTSSVKKGETLRDTARNIEAMKVDMVVMRHGSPGAPHFLADHLDASIINAGDGPHEHPTQALLDIFTMREKVGPLAGKRVTIVGDILHSRVARSDVWGLRALGAEVTLCGPRTLMPAQAESLGVAVETDLVAAIRDADVVNILRIQKERQSGSFLPTLREYTELFGLDARRLAHLRPDAIVMHPGPINRGVELSPDVADGERSVILDQVTNGVAVRMAVIYLVSRVRATEQAEDSQLLEGVSV